MISKFIRIISLSLVALSLTAFAQADLAGRVNKIIAKHKKSDVTFAVKIVQADTHRTLYQLNPNLPMMPASNMKLITTAAALHYLGPDFQYVTRIAMLDDSLVIIASGDPLLGDQKTDAVLNRPNGWIFQSIASILKQRGVNKINDIAIKSQILDDIYTHSNWPADQLNRWYACQVASLNYNCNCIDLTVKNKSGKPVVIVEPKTNYVKITNQVIINTQKSGAVGAYSVPNQPNHLLVKGRCKSQQGPFPVTIQFPQAFFGCLLAESLTQNGINITGDIVSIKGQIENRLKNLTEFKTPIWLCIQRANTDSLGLAAEALLKTIAHHKTAKPGSWPAARVCVTDYLNSLNVESAEFFIDDGSGLSRNNRLSANTITAVLLDISQKPYYNRFKDTLAVGGKTGTISRYFKTTPHKGNIIGKTGYIKGVRTFSGICKTKKGDIIFSILTNGKAYTRNAINDIAKAVIDEFETPSD
jgi:D-alanyl-D-alanine carboxypeptidase/D-alanyl-D-alanine-endopeptidase (penicillin-binding protein 4)